MPKKEPDETGPLEALNDLIFGRTYDGPKGTSQETSESDDDEEEETDHATKPAPKHRPKPKPLVGGVLKPSKRPRGRPPKNRAADATGTETKGSPAKE